MYSCPLHNWFSDYLPCPECSKRTITTSDIVINAEGTSALPGDKSEGEDELENDIRTLAMYDEFREYNGNYCPDGFNVNKFITKLLTSFSIKKKQ